MIAAPGITLIQRVVPLLLAVSVAAAAVELIRRRKLREEYAMLWIGASVVLVILAVFPTWLMWLANTVGIYYITLMLLASFGFLSLVAIHLSMTVSKAADNERDLAQKLSLLEQRLEQLESKSGDGGNGGNPEQGTGNPSKDTAEPGARNK